MIEYANPVDIGSSAVLRQIAEQVRRTRRPIPLTQDDEIVAVVQPVPSPGRNTLDVAAEDIWGAYDPAKVTQALAASGGALTGVDRDELLADIRAQRGQNSQGRPE